MVDRRLWRTIFCPRLPQTKKKQKRNKKEGAPSSQFYAFGEMLVVAQLVREKFFQFGVFATSTQAALCAKPCQQCWHGFAYRSLKQAVTETPNLGIAPLRLFGVCVMQWLRKFPIFASYSKIIMASYKFILNLYHKPGRGLFSCLIS